MFLPVRLDLVLEIARDVRKFPDAVEEHPLRGRRWRIDLQFGVRGHDRAVRPELGPVERPLEVAGAEVHLGRSATRLRSRKVDDEKARREVLVTLLIVGEHGRNRRLLRACDDRQSRQTRGHYEDVNACGAGCSKHWQMLLINEAWAVILAYSGATRC